MFLENPLGSKSILVVFEWMFRTWRVCGDRRLGGDRLSEGAQSNLDDVAGDQLSLWKVLQLLTALVLTKLPMVMSQLNITSVEELFIYTGVFTMGKVWKRNSTTIITIIYNCVKDNRPLLWGQWRTPGHLACWSLAASWSPRGVFVFFSSRLYLYSWSWLEYDLKRARNSIVFFFSFFWFFLKGRGIQLRDKRDEWRWKLEQCGHSEGNWLRLPKIAH